MIDTKFKTVYFNIDCPVCGKPYAWKTVTPGGIYVACPCTKGLEVVSIEWLSIDITPNFFDAGKANTEDVLDEHKDKF